MNVRAEPTPVRARLLEAAAVSVLERALAQLEGGTLEVALPDGTRRRFGSGPPVRLDVHDTAFFRRLATRGKLGPGESYTAGEWDSDNLPRLFELLLLNADAAGTRHARVRRLLELRPRLHRRNGLVRARRNIAYHYDLGNELFALMLDETMTYSCAIFDRPEASLADAQRAKYRRLCERLELDRDDHVLEIGCGWGGFARYAAERHGCRVTGLTISAEQAALARERTAGLPVEIR
ncbi:MAG: class I SAM-dependent methyltransferase, partial [Gaiellaceae bacterium]